MRIFPNISLNRAARQQHFAARRGRMRFLHAVNPVIGAVNRDILPGNGMPFERGTVRFKRVKPRKTALFLGPLFRRFHAHFLFVPVLIQKPDKQLLHRHLPDAVNVQIRQNARDIIEQNPVAPDDIKILRPVLRRIVV